MISPAGHTAAQASRRARPRKCASRCGRGPGRKREQGSHPNREKTAEREQHCTSSPTSRRVLNGCVNFASATTQRHCSPHRCLLSAARPTTVSPQGRQNVRTFLKTVCLFGGGRALCATGCDSGRLLIWDVKTGQIVHRGRADGQAREGSVSPRARQGASWPPTAAPTAAREAQQEVANARHQRGRLLLPAQQAFGGCPFLSEAAPPMRLPTLPPRPSTQIVNVAVAHPTLPILAVSGIDDDIKIFHPGTTTFDSGRVRLIFGHSKGVLSAVVCGLLIEKTLEARSVQLWHRCAVSKAFSGRVGADHALGTLTSTLHSPASHEQLRPAARRASTCRLRRSSSA